MITKTSPNFTGRAHRWTWIYGLYCPQGCLAYVGMTRNLGVRIAQHIRDGKVFGSIEADIYSTRREAQLAEAQAIIRYLPPWNGDWLAWGVKGLVHGTDVYNRYEGYVNHKSESCKHGWTP